MPETPRGYPYPDGGVQPDVPYWLQQLAEAINDDVTALAADTGWVAPTFLGGWSSPTYPVSYRRKGNEVWLRGQAQPGAGGDIFTLPEGFRPTYRITALVSTGTATSANRLAIEPDGRVVAAGSVSTVTLDVVRFLVG